jgi:hypothetical protein
MVWHYEFFPSNGRFWTGTKRYLEQHAGERKAMIFDLLDVWAAAMADENMRKTAQELLFGLNPADGRR